MSVMLSLQRHFLLESQWHDIVTGPKRRGMVGTYAGLGDHAIKIEQSFAAELGLKSPYPDDWHGTRDVYASYALTLALIAKSYGRIGQELFLLQMTDIGETAEPRSATAVSSSSMAQKVNPSKSEALIHSSRTIPRMAEVILDDVINFFERDSTSGATAVLAEISIESDENLKTAAQLLGAIEIDREVMRGNFAKSKGFVMAQRVSQALSVGLGKAGADSHIRDLIQQAIKARIDFKTALLSDAVISKMLTATEIDNLLDPAGYVGRSQDEIKAVIHQAEALRLQDPVE
jgi:adenylosuccinate lyase